MQPHPQSSSNLLVQCTVTDDKNKTHWDIHNARLYIITQSVGIAACAQERMFASSKRSQQQLPMREKKRKKKTERGDSRRLTWESINNDYRL